MNSRNTSSVKNLLTIKHNWYNWPMKQPKVALIHDYLVQYGGAEKTLEAICEIFPDAPIYTGIYKPEMMSDLINSKKIYSAGNTLFKLFPKHLTFLMPYVFEAFDLREYDLIISDGTAWPKGVITTPDQLHISYVHTPPRFLYGYSVETSKRNNWYFRPFVAVIDHILRIWDYSAAQRPDYLLTNSEEIKRRIRKFYNRDAKVIYPPVETDYKVNHENTNYGEKKKSPYFLALGRLAIYKNFHLTIDAIKETDFRLIIAGTGPEEDRLRKMAPPEQIELVGKVSDEEKHALLEDAVGLINAVADEDFGIVPIEAMAHGTPVLAYKAGGHLETVKENITGEFFNSLDPHKMAVSINKFHKHIENGMYKKNDLVKTSKEFSKERFIEQFKKFVMEKWDARIA